MSDNVMTAEELQNAARNAVKGMGFASGECPQATPEPPAEPPAAPAAPPAEPPAEPAQPAAPAAPAKTEAELQADREKSLIERAASEAATRTAQSMAQPTQPAQPVAPTPEPVDLTEGMGKEDREEYEALKVLEESDPEKFAGKAKAFAEFTKKNYEYQDKWLAANPDREFNPDDAEHNEWYTANQPDINRDAIEQAKEEVRINKLVEKRFKPLEEKRRQEEVAKTIEQHIPVVAKVVTDRLSKLVEHVDPNLVAHLKNANGEISIGAESQARLKQADPIAARELEKNAVIAERLIVELEKTAIPGLDYRLNPKANPLHAEIHRFHLELESEIKAKPASEQVIDGKKFVTVADYNTHINHLKSTVPKQNLESAIASYDASVATVTIEDIEEKIVKHYATEAKKVIDEIESVAKRKYGAQENPQPNPTAQTQRTPAPGAAKPKTPGVGSQSVPVTTNVPGQADEKNMLSSVMKQMFGK